MRNNEQDVGVTPSGSGSRPTDGAASTGVSTVPASIPNAAWPEVEWEDGYPVAEDDDFQAWEMLPLSFEQAAWFVLHELPKAAEHCCASCDVEDASDRYFSERSIKRIHFSTGGWSGAESLIAFIESRFDTRHFMESWRRGGHYVFEIDCELINRAAQAIEARRAETAETGSVADESAVPAGNAPESHGNNRSGETR